MASHTAGRQLGSSLLVVYSCLLKCCKLTECGALVWGSVWDNLDDYFNFELRITGLTPCYYLRGGTRGLRMIHTAHSLLSNSLCTFTVRESANHYAPPLCPIHTGCESVSAPSLTAFLFSTINKKLLLPALEITGLLPSSSQKGGCHIHRCPTSDRVVARSIFSEGR